MARLLLISVSLLALACAGPGATTRPPTAAPPSAAVTAVASASAATVSMSSAGYFVGPNGMSLYTFDKDSPGATVCSGDCLVNWPALVVPSASAITVGTGLNTADFSTVTRPEGPLQVAFKQIPLYFFAADTAPGDTNGDGVGGVWHLATTASTLPPPAAATPSAAASMGTTLEASPSDAGKY